MLILELQLTVRSYFLIQCINTINPTCIGLKCEKRGGDQWKHIR